MPVLPHAIRHGGGQHEMKEGVPGMCQYRRGKYVHTKSWPLGTTSGIWICPGSSLRVSSALDS
jgi:hypothetical protein